MEESGFLHMVSFYLSLVLGYIIGAFYGLVVITLFFLKFLKNPAKRFWQFKKRELPPACLNDPSLGNHAYVQIKNVKLHYVEKGDRSHPLMLCLHGFPEFWYSWRHQLREFSSDYWVVAVDMRGYGDSEKPVGQNNYKLSVLQEDIKNLLSALGKEKCTLLAHDWGGVLAWFFVLNEPHLVDSYIIMNSVHPVPYEKILRTNWKQFRKSWYLFFFQCPLIPEVFCGMDDMAWIASAMLSVKTDYTTDEDIETFKFMFGKPGALTFPIHYYRANFMLPCGPKLGPLSKNKALPPGLIMFGEEDKFVTKELQEETVKLVANSRLFCIRGANHFLQQTAPDIVNKEIKLFLNEIKSKTNYEVDNIE